MSVVIIPAYKPGPVLVSLADQLWTAGCRIIVVDDGSGEEYDAIFHKISNICVILRHSENLGKGAAIKTALSYIEEEMRDIDCVGIMDADGQHLTEDMLKLLAFARGHRRSLVLGVRQVGKQMPLKSRLGNRITRLVFRLLSGVRISDTQTGLRAFDAELVKEFLPVKGERYEYEMNVLMMAAKAEIPIEEVPVHTVYHDESNSCSHFRSFRDSVRIYKDLLKFSFSSASSFVLDYCLFSLLMIFLPHTAVMVFAANVLARFVSAFYNYGMNCRFVFHTRAKVRTALDYFALAAFILVMNNLILEFFVQVIHFSVYPAKLLTECLLFFISWLVQRYFIFRKKEITYIACRKAEDQ